ncbi:MAG: PACE efflux transporter [Zoogloeaceae bacterium]|jgi:uncharacterized membrane protein|nr:PACE efflux transporter [Zoogloeaceae bacterium]
MKFRRTNGNNTQRTIMTPPRSRAFPERLHQAFLFEGIGLVVVTPLFALASGRPVFSSAVLLLLLSGMAVGWHLLYCLAFDRLEGRLAHRAADQRSFPLRLLHALGFEGGLILLTLPVIMFWTQMSLWRALLADVGLALAYAGYACLFNLAYDRLYPIPQDSR